MTQTACLLDTQVTKSLRLPYLLGLPDGYGAEPERTWPLILFLHGAGERGDDLTLLRKHGLAKVLEERQDLPLICVSPQCPADNWWSDHIDALDALLNEMTSAYAVDLDRIYLTGLSMGGYGAWHLAVTYPGRFAAVVPICGGGPWPYGFPERVCVLKDTPVWAFHGAKDDVVPLRESEVLVQALKGCGGEVRFTVYPDAAHDSWTQTYDDPELYAWLLAHKRSDRSG